MLPTRPVNRSCRSAIALRRGRAHPVSTRHVNASKVFGPTMPSTMTGDVSGAGAEGSRQLVVALASAAPDHVLQECRIRSDMKQLVQRAAGPSCMPAAPL